MRGESPRPVSRNATTSALRGAQEMTVLREHVLQHVQDPVNIRRGVLDRVAVMGRGAAVVMEVNAALPAAAQAAPGLRF